MASFFSRKRHTAQPPAAPAPAPAPQPQPQLQQPSQTLSAGSIGRAQAPPRPQPPPQSLQQQPPQQTPEHPQQQQPQPQPQPQPPSTGHVQTPSQSGGSSRPRQDYPWSVRRLQVEAPMRVAGGTGTSVTSMTGPPLPRYGHSVPLVATPGGDIFVFGGLVKDQVKDDLWMLRGVWGPDAGTRRATKEMGVVASLLETTGDAPGPRVGHKSALVSSVLIVWGGDTLAKEGERNDDGLYLLNLTTRDWTRVTTVGAVPVGRYGHAVGMSGNKFIVFGGQVDGEFLNDLWSFDLQSLVRGTSAWEQLTPVPGNEPPPKRTGHVLVTHENKIYIFGGTDGAFHYNDTWCFDMQTRTWTELTCIGFIPVPREGHAAALVGDVMYVFGGRGVDGKDLGDLGSFKISNHRWYMFQNMGPQPSGRSGHAMSTADGRIFVLGGESGEVGPTRDDSMMIHVLDTNLIKYPESKPGSAPQRRINGGVTSPPPGPQTMIAQGQGASTPQRGLGLGLERGNGTPDGPRASGTPDGPRGVASGDEGRDPRRQQAPIAEDPRRQVAQPEDPRRQQPLEDPRRQQPSEDLRRIQQIEDLRRGAQSVDEPRRLPDESRRGAQSVDEPRRLPDEQRRLDESWRSAQGVPEEVRRAREAAAVSPGSRDGHASRDGHTISSRDGHTATSRDGHTSGGAPPRPPRRSDVESADEGEGERAKSSGERAKSPAERARSPQGALERARSPQDALERAKSPQDALGLQQGSLHARSPSDVTHARTPSDVNMSNMSGHGRNPSEVQHTRNPSEVQHARTPSELTPDRARSPPGKSSPINMAAVAMRAQGSNSRSNSPADLKPTVNGHTRAGSAVSNRGSPLIAQDRASPLVGGGSPLVGSAQEELEALRRRDAWMRAALARASAAGFVWADQDQDGLGEWTVEDAPAKLADLVVGLKQQQAKLQSSFVAQLQSASDRLNEADRVKTAALQEAAFCRAKLAAYESTLENDPAKLEREKSAQLERLVVAAQTERGVLERTLLERTDALALQTQLREQAEERAADAIRRAEIAEEDMARAKDQLQKFVVVQSSIKQHEAEHAAVLKKLEEATTLRDQHMRALEQTQQALAATTARADDMERQWERSTGMIQSLEEDLERTRNELNERAQESQRAVERLRDVEEAWTKSREEADAHRHATTSSLGMLLDSHKELMADEDRASRGHAEKVHAMEMEISGLRKMLTEAGNRITGNQTDLVAHQRKASTAIADAAAVRAQLDGVRAQLTSHIIEQGRLKQEIAMKEAAVRERVSAASSAEVRLGMLRKYLVDNGIVIDEEDINSDNENRGGMVRVQQLENELRERTRLYQDLERELQDANRRREDAEARIHHLAQQLERAKSAASPSSPDAEGRAASAERKREETETRLNKRIQELDHDYQMAVKYVKGTEKMMRRMKEDYAKSKALNEKLQADLDTLRGITSSEAGSRTRGATGRNTPLSDEGHDSIRSQLVESQRSLQRLTTDRNELKRQLEALQRDLEQSREDLVIAQNEGSEREVQIEELEAKIEHLERSLILARNGPDETVVERLTNENATLRREKDALSHRVHILLDDQGGYGEDRRVSGISQRESQASTENGMTQFDSFEDWQQRINSRASTTRESDYEPSTPHLQHTRARPGA
ncbi:Tip elongation aberrant protein 1 OS=Schizosaccharomyces pombe (strain 972 / ATCC 24843) GN=tea1 PE=1 SV=1 [Rhizoctonia solani AG-1 IB]|uniref:Tip elongation aberrant protein 1 n=1 Tax=Thanatephorus cucumeris (strain AG1-IB / isolate 7/3/14) TaxID=1108050 RepID=A0A0B7FLZ6_THACB|nr:Tip elongation aberrant protein 1 OS=Schizosaccharomyces pombe (strain 972 / ATCC 24843) GN=tea1 PE=1 SV=1 [Rhizoctonia solani AG-1 IB]